MDVFTASVAYACVWLSRVTLRTNVYVQTHMLYIENTVGYLHCQWL